MRGTTTWDWWLLSKWRQVEPQVTDTRQLDDWQMQLSNRKLCTCLVGGYMKWFVSHSQMSCRQNCGTLAPFLLCLTKEDDLVSEVLLWLSNLFRTWHLLNVASFNYLYISKKNKTLSCRNKCWELKTQGAALYFCHKMAELHHFINHTGTKYNLSKHVNFILIKMENKSRGYFNNYMKAIKKRLRTFFYSKKTFSVGKKKPK